MVGLPGEYWDMEILRDTGNSIGEFVKVFEQTRIERYTTYACICIYMDLSKDLPKAVILNWEDEECIQQIDYEQIPFHCRICHEYGHFERNCPKGTQEKVDPEQEGEKRANEGFMKVKGGRWGKYNGDREVKRKQRKSP